MKKIQIRSVNALKLDVLHALNNANKRQACSYRLTLQHLNTLPEGVKLEVRGVNGGDIAEAVLKYHLFGDAVLTYSRQGLKDLEGEKVSEVKFFGASNNTPNGTLTPRAFVGITPWGVYHFTYKIVKQYFKDFKLDNRKGTRAMTYSLAKYLIDTNQVKEIQEYSKALGY